MINIGFKYEMELGVIADRNEVIKWYGIKR